LTFNANNFDTAQTATVAAVSDPDADVETVNIVASGVGNNDVTIEVTVTDDETQSIIVTPPALTLAEEGDQGLFAVRLNAAPQADTTVILSPDDTSKLALGSTSLVFTTSDWSNLRWVTASGLDDVDIINDLIEVTLTSSGIADTVYPVTVIDTDVLKIIASESELFLTEGGADGYFTVALSHQPATNVVVTVTSTNSDAATAVPSEINVPADTLTFTPQNYADLQSVVVAPQEDADVLDETLEVQLSSVDLATVPVAVSVDDDD
jgi:hypothetical protein